MSIPGPHDIKRHELPNGITVLVREHHASPSVVLRGSLRVGAYDEPAERTGLAAFTSDALMRGTDNRSFDQIYEELESVGASLGISAATHNTGFGAKSLVEDLSLLLSILSDALRNPTFPVDEVEKLRGEILSDLDDRVHNTRRMANLAFHELAYPEEHPYSRAVSGYPETVRSITRDDLVAFHEEGYGPEGAILVIVGAVDTDEALEQVEEALGDWEGSVFERQPLPDVPQLDGIREKEIPIPGKTQSDIVLGVPGPARSEPDFLPAMVANCILGLFGMMGRLGESVREEQGLAYYSYSRLEGGLGPGPWRVIAGVAPDAVDQAIESIKAEIRRLCEEPIPEEELRDNQTFITGSLPLRLETNEGVARTLLSMERHNLGLDYLQRYKDVIESFTVDEVQAAAQHWLDDNAYAVGISGPPEE